MAGICCMNHSTALAFELPHQELAHVAQQLTALAWELPLVGLRVDKEPAAATSSGSSDVFAGSEQRKGGKHQYCSDNASCGQALMSQPCQGELDSGCCTNACLQ